MIRDRTDAGKKLARLLGTYNNRHDVIVLGLARGGIPVAYEVARAIKAPLDVFIVRKVGVPHHPEVALAAIATGGAIQFNEEIVSDLALPAATLDAIVHAERAELERRETVYRAGRTPLDLRNRRVILVDDGLATGASMLVAVRSVKAHRPKELVVAVPVMAAAAYERLRSQVDHIFCVLAPYDFRSVGQWYEDFSQTSDEEVKACLTRSDHDQANATSFGRDKKAHGGTRSTR